MLPSGRPAYYVLDGHEPRPLYGPDAVLEWGRWFETCTRRVDFTDLGWCSVSTVFLGIDHNFSRQGPPLLFESMIFGTPAAEKVFPEELFEVCERTATWDEAQAAHDRLVAFARAAWGKRRANDK